MRPHKILSLRNYCLYSVNGVVTTHLMTDEDQACIAFASELTHGTWEKHMLI